MTIMSVHIFVGIWVAVSHRQKEPVISASVAGWDMVVMLLLGLFVIYEICL